MINKKATVKIYEDDINVLYEKVESSTRAGIDVPLPMVQTGQWKISKVSLPLTLLLRVPERQLILRRTFCTKFRQPHHHSRHVFYSMKFSVIRWSRRPTFSLALYYQYNDSCKHLVIHMFKQTIRPRSEKLKCSDDFTQ